MANIKNNNSRKIDCRLYNDMYMDFMLSKDEGMYVPSIDNCLPIKINFNVNNCKPVVAETAWNKAVTSNDVLENIGYTAVDNGLITYDKDRIGNDEFLDLFVNSSLDLSTYNDKFYMNPVSANTQVLSYPIECHDGFTALKGGFYQGFFKIDGSKYQTLPHKIDDEWRFDVTLRPKQYETSSNILNKRNPENSGIFFYIGTRAENKFWELYKQSVQMSDLKVDDISDYNTDYNFHESDVVNSQYVNDEAHPEYRDENYGYSCNCDDYFDDGFDPYGETDGNNGACEYTAYFDDDYTGPGTVCDCSDNDMVIDDEYIMEQISLESVELTDTKGFSLEETGFYEIETDNKFIIFNQTKDGYNTKTWKDEFKYIITGQTVAPNINYYPYLNQTKTGYTKDNISQLIQEHSYAYNVFKDITNNAFALKLNENGSISYRYLIADCDSENGFSVQEETTKPNLVKNDEWSTIAIKFVKLNDKSMKLYLYVNNQLKLVSKELPLLNLRRLDDLSTRQEAVPYTISIGGGTLGLSERIFLDYYNITDYKLPLETNFAGTFIGDIKEMTFNDCYVPYITNYQTNKVF